MMDAEYQYIYCPHLNTPLGDYEANGGGALRVPLTPDAELHLCPLCANQVKLSLLLQLMPKPQPTTIWYPTPFQWRGY